VCDKMSLYEAIRLLRTEKEFERFWEDLLTPKERKKIMIRWRTFCLMCIEPSTQREARKRLGVSLDTVNKACQILFNKGTGEIRRVIQKLYREKESGLGAAIADRK
jgi:uncharacterized protein YerC